MTPYDRIRAVLESDLPKAQAWVLLVYARYDMGQGAWPSTSTVARESRLCERAVRAAKADLIQAGLLRFDGYSYAGTKRYIVSQPAPHAAPRHTVPPPGIQCRPDRHPVPPRPAPHAANKGREREREGAPSPDPSRGEGETEVQKMADALLANLHEHGAGAPLWWLDPSPQQVSHVGGMLRELGCHTGRGRWVKRALLIAYNGGET